jgi:putative membrane-bound dehydrogenase-like protein
MVRLVPFAIVFAAVTGFLSAQTGKPWPPPVQKVSASPVLSPAEAIASFALPPGYRIELVASEPLVQDPILMDWDADGRLWVVELPNYMRDMAATGELEPTGRVVVLEDTDDDGKMDTRAVFADGFYQPRGALVLDRGVLVGDPPDVWLLRDTDGDLRADQRERVATGYGRRNANVEINANSFLWALDNRIYSVGADAAMYFRVKEGAIEIGQSLSRGQWGLSQDDAGRIYRNHNESALHVDLVPTLYYARNPNLLRTRGSHEVVIDPAGDVNAVFPIRQTPGTNRAYQYGILREDGTLAAFTAACAPIVYRGDRLPSELRGNAFVAEPAANLVSRLIVYDDGNTLRARRAYERAEFVASTDERFRPVYLSSGPDGALYITDMYRGIIQHRAFVTEYLRDQIVDRKLDQGVALGRIYRVVHETTRRDSRPRFSRASTAQLVAALSHPNGWRRDTAQRLLVERGDRTAVPALVKAAADAADWRARLHALWTLDGLDAIEPPVVERALKDPSAEVRTTAVRIADRWLETADHPLAAAVIARLDDAHWSVKRQAAASIGAMPAGSREATAGRVLARFGDDPIVVDAVLSGLRGSEFDVLDRLLAGGDESRTQREAAVVMLAATLLRSGRESTAHDVFERAADAARPQWQRSALLTGAEVALLGAPMPGMPPPRRSPAASANAPCPTCPGGRGGPGGAYAFRTQEDVAAAASLRSGRGNRPTLRLNREPAALTAWVSKPDELSPRAAALLARVSWPGKPGEPAPVAPLTGEEQARFDAGREVYRNICQACHQPDGRGQDRVAPTLIDSALTLARPEIPIRILLNGKEGAVGLMPPIGGTLNDDQIAAVLTYVRREWGHTGSPVEPGVVAKVRALSAERARPWTEKELLELIGQ